MTSPWKSRRHCGFGVAPVGPRRWPWLLLLLPLVWGTILLARQATAETPLDLGGPLPCGSGPRLVVTVLDVSSSVIDPQGADPKGRSFDEARAVAEHLAKHPCHPDDRFGAVIFADQPVALEPTLLTSASIVQAALRRPPASELGGGTNLLAAIDTAKAMAARFPGHDRTVVVLSDMQQDQPADVLGAALDRLGGHAAVHLVALGDHDATFDPRFEDVHEIDRVHRGAVARALVDAIAATRP